MSVSEGRFPDALPSAFPEGGSGASGPGARFLNGGGPVVRFGSFRLQASAEGVLRHFADLRSSLIPNHGTVV
jgi:hypothetical protein